MRPRGLTERTGDWTIACFGNEIAHDQVERIHRFLEEALELAQAVDCDKETVLQLVDYVYNRPVGEMTQEIGGVVVTLSALCFAYDVDMEDLGDKELDRVWTKLDKIREKQRNKPKMGPLPE